MNAALGQAGVVLGLTASVLGLATLVVALVRHRHDRIRLAVQYAVLVLAGAVLAFAAMERALITRDFSVSFVAEHGSRRTPALYNVATLWSALEGSILLWVLVLAGYLTATVVKFRRRLDDRLLGVALAVQLAVCVFFFTLLVGPANPFGRIDPVPFDGPGPNPLLQNHPLMAFHPPVLYLGYVGFTVPFSFAIAALVTGRVGEGWLVASRRWTLAAWGFLTVGVLAGAWWSYEVLGWAGYWAWDPVENASFLPWLCATAYLHSVMVQERRGMLRVWNLSLLCATFSLTILGTFLTRSGVVESVHAFTEGSIIGKLLLGFFALVVVTSVGLIGWRGDRLRSPGRIDSPLSREGAFLLNNVAFAAFAFVVLLGTVFPLILEATAGRRVSVGAQYFDTMTAPIGFTLLFLMAVAPVLPWRKASGELLRTRLLGPAWCGAAVLVVAVLAGARGAAPLGAFTLAGFAAGAAGRQLLLATRRQGWRGLVGRANGGMVVHLGVVLVAVAYAASSSYASEAEVRLLPGQSATVGGHTVTFEGMELRELPERIADVARLRVDGGSVHEPSISRYRARGEVIGAPSVKPSVVDDVYLTLVERPDAEGRATIRVVVEPLVSWLWVGGAVMAAGTVLALFPGKARRRPTAAASAPLEGTPVVDEPTPATVAAPHQPVEVG
jgi:cytochrome c-type biogenesis protein CcmF